MKTQTAQIQDFVLNCDFCNNIGEIIVGAVAEDYERALANKEVGIFPCPKCNKLESEVEN